MSGLPARTTVTAAWSLQGKAPGQVAYDVQAGSVEPRTAQKYFWTASTETPRADRAQAPDALPWVAFLGGTEAGRSVTGLVETVWSGGRDATGRISYSARLLILDWQPTSEAGLTWSALYGAALDARWPDPDPGAEHPPRITLDAAPTTVAKLARFIEGELGFEWAARCAALLLEGRHVAITLSPEHATLNAVTRVAVLDGICALLPYGCRAWLSAATWAGHGADHELRLTFALRPRGNQCHAVLSGQPPQGPGTAQGRAYVAELLRLRQKKGIEVLLSHLLSHRAPLAPHDAEQALQHLRDLDLQALVMGDIDRGTSRLFDVARLLDRHPLDSLAEQEAATVARHLARCALPGSRPEAEREQARSLLLEHWSPGAARALAHELNSWPVEEQTPSRIRGVLDLALAAVPRDPQAHAETLTGYLSGAAAAGTPEGLRARSTLLHALQRDLDESTAAAVCAVLVRHPELTLGWLDLNAERNTLDDRLVRELLQRTGAANGLGAPDWLLGAALFLRASPDVPAGTSSIDAFVAVSETAWRTGLNLARRAGNPDALAALKPELYDIAAGRDGTDADRDFLRDAIDVLVPVRPGLGGIHAAWADLFQRRLVGGAMRRARCLADDGRAPADYAAVLRRELPQLGLLSWEEATLAEGLVGDRPERVPHLVLWELIHPRDPGAVGLKSLEDPVLDRIADLLKHTGDWLTHGMPAQWEHRLRSRPDLQWLAHTAEIRRLVATRSATPEALGDAIVRASPNSRYARRAQQAAEFPSAVVEAITPWLHDCVAHVDLLHRLAAHLNRASPQQALGDLLYHSISQLRFGELVRQQALDRHEELKDGVERAIRLLRQKPSPRRQPTVPAPPPGQAGPPGTGRHGTPPGAPPPTGMRPLGGPARPVPGTGPELDRDTLWQRFWRSRGEDRR
ncbi:hypothetical protein ACFYN5_25940 [Streptomyces sp. NPDC007126]|uniref:hypothetical protein n=1 Tax=Streptomyces sp. NPDC007126 TaxID=3364774 RepID=UPI0036CA2F8B